MAKRRSKRNGNVKLFTALVIILVIAIALLYVLDMYGVVDIPFEELWGTTEPGHTDTGNTVISGDLQIHFLELGNKYTGDCTYIKVGDIDILIDAGSRTNSIPTITEYINNYCTDGILEYVIVTHAHQDHYAGFAGSKSQPSIFTYYECETIIDFALTNNSSSTMYKNYQTQLQNEINEGAVHYTAAECIENDNYIFELSDGITLQILDSYYYYNKASDENDYSVCCMINQGDAHFLFTGDLEKSGEEHLVEMNDLPKVELFKAGHHGSKTSSNDALLSVIQPEIVCVCCCAGSDEYTSANENQFPTQAFCDRIAKYTDKVYVTTISVDNETGEFTSMNGNIIVSSSPNGVTVYCSASDTLLKDSEWFKKNRNCPNAWK